MRYRTSPKWWDDEFYMEELVYAKKVLLKKKSKASDDEKRVIDKKINNRDFYLDSKIKYMKKINTNMKPKKKLAYLDRTDKTD
jgi:hypothetical protein